MEPISTNLTRGQKAYVIRETPSWLHSRQDWISDGARRLYLALRTLADHKTGRLFIPGKGWISPRTIERRAGMSKPTRLRYTRELAALGAITFHQDYTIRTINGRRRKVLGQAQYTIFPLKHRGSTADKEQKLNTGEVSTADKNAENQISPQKHGVSTAEQPLEILLRTNSTAALEVVRQFLSEDHQGAGAGEGEIVFEGFERALPVSSSPAKTAARVPNYLDELRPKEKPAAIPNYLDYLLASRTVH